MSIVTSNYRHEDVDISMKTAKEIANAVGITRRTLDRWVRRGLIPAPTFRPSPSGRGALAVWPDWVVETCEDIRDGGAVVREHRMDARLSPSHLDRAIELLGDHADSSRQGARPKLSAAQSTEAEELLRGAVLARLDHLLGSSIAPRRFLAQLRRSSLVSDALCLNGAGFNPVLVFDGRDAYVAPDFLAVERVRADAPAVASPVLALPLFDLVCRVLEEIGAERLSDPVVEPARWVVVRERGRATRVPYRPVGVRRARLGADAILHGDDDE